MDNDTICISADEIAENTQSPIKERWVMVASRTSLSLTTVRENGCSGPGIRITWVDLGHLAPQSRRWAPRVDLFSDCWLAFTELRDVFEMLASLDSHIAPGQATPDAVLAALLELGFELVDIDGGRGPHLHAPE